MLNNDEVITAIGRRLIKFVNEVRFRSSDGTLLLYVGLEKVADKVSPGFTSNKQMNNLANRLAKNFSSEVAVIYTIKEGHDDLENAFFQILKQKFTDQILSFYISYSDKTTVNTWLEVSELSDKLKNRIEEYYIKLLQEADLSINSIQWIDSNLDLPSIPWLLRFLKANQPLNLSSIMKVLVKEFPTINDKWLNHKLDYIRKKGMLIREKDGNYCLSFKGLSVVPAGTRRSSSDIDRALALGRNKW